MFNFIILNLIVVLACVILMRRVFRGRSLPDNICNFSIFFLAQIIFSEMLLGVFNKLFLGNLILLNLSILFIIWFLSKGKRGKLFTIKAGGQGWLVKNKTVLFCLSAILGFLLVKSLFNLFNPPLGWDSLNYHFTFPVEWLKQGSLYLPPTICGDPTPTYYPINSSLYYYWLIAPFRNVFLADLGQVPFYLLSFAACFSIARKFKLSKELAFYGAALLLITPNFFKQIEVGYADIVMAGLFFVALNALFNLAREFKLKNLLLAGIAAGILLGIKTLSLVYVAVLILFFIYILFKNSRGLRLLKCGSLFFTLLLVFGGYGYIRNFILSGNPLFPLHFEVLGKVVFAGVMPKATYLVRWTSEGYNLVKLFFSEGMGIQLFLLIFPATFIAPALILFKRRRRKEKTDFALVYFLLLPAILYFVFRYFIPQLWTRFLYPYLGVGAVLAIYLLDHLRVPLKVIRGIVVACFLASIFELSGHAELGLSMAAFIVLFFTLPLLSAFFSQSKYRRQVTALLIIISLAGFYFGQKWYLDHEYERYISEAPYQKGAAEGWKWLNDHTDEARIAYTGWPFPFALYGTDFKNDVYYVSINNIHPAQLHLFPEGNLDWPRYRTDIIEAVSMRDENYRGKANFIQWYENLTAESTDYLYIYTFKFDKKPFSPIEDRWARNHPDKFELVLDNASARIYRVK